MTKPSRLSPDRCNEIIAKARAIASGEALGFSRDAVIRISKCLGELDDLNRRSFTRKKGIKFHVGDADKFYFAHDAMVRRLFGVIVGVDSPNQIEPAHQLPTTQSAPVSTKRVTDADRLSQLNRDLKARHAANRSKS